MISWSDKLKTLFANSKEIAKAKNFRRLQINFAIGAKAYRTANRIKPYYFSINSLTEFVGRY